MTLPSSGQITAAMVNVELGRSSTAYFNMNGSAERTLAGVPSGSYGMNSFYGKSLGLPRTATITPASLGGATTGTGWASGSDVYNNGGSLSPNPIGWGDRAMKSCATETGLSLRIEFAGTAAVSGIVSAQVGGFSKLNISTAYTYFTANSRVYQWDGTAQLSVGGTTSITLA